MMLKFTRMLAAVVFALAVALPVQAQGVISGSGARHREGFWFNGGLGWGSLGCQDCTDREGGMSGNLSLGGTLNDKVLLGVGTNGWTKEEDGTRLTVGTLTAQIRFYPTGAAGRFFLIGGLGVGTISMNDSYYGNASDNGAGALLGLGYDIPIGPSSSITPFWNGIGVSINGGDANFGQIGIGIHIH